jgi:hypothetical protein
MRAANTRRSSEDRLERRLFHGLQGVEQVRYDNERGKGAPGHLSGFEGAYAFVALDRLLDVFERDIQAWRATLKAVIAGAKSGCAVRTARRLIRRGVRLTSRDMARKMPIRPSRGRVEPDPTHLVGQARQPLHRHPARSQPNGETP